MKTTFISLIALGVAVAMAGPVDRALADQPMVLTDAQLDRVTAGSHIAHYNAPILLTRRESVPASAVSIKFGEGHVINELADLGAVRGRATITFSIQEPRSSGR